MHMKRMAWGMVAFLLLGALPALAVANDAAVKYATKITVSEYGVVSVSETLTFNESPSEGLLVYSIPEEIAQQQGFVEGLTVEGCDFAIETTDTCINISMYNPKGAVHIAYSRSILQDGNENRDMVAVSLLPSISLPVRSATATVVMPSRFEQQDITFFGLQDISYDYYVTSQQLSGSLLAPLPPQTPLQAVFTLPEGYFVQTPSPSPYIAAGQEAVPDDAGIARISVYVLAAICALSLLLFAFSRTNKMRDGQSSCFDPSQAGYIARGYVKNGDLVGLLPYWASRGILSMEMLPDRRIRFIQTKPLPDDAPNVHRQLLQALFHGQTEITLGSLSHSFRQEVRKIRMEIECGYNNEKNRVFTKASLTGKSASVVFLYLSLAMLLYCAVPIAPMFIRIYSALLLPIVFLYALMPLLKHIYAARILSTVGCILNLAGLALFFAGIIAISWWAVWLQPRLYPMATMACASVITHALIYLLSGKRTYMGARQLDKLKSIIYDLKNPPIGLSSTEMEQLYAYSIALRIPMAGNDPWGEETTSILRNMQKVWNWLERPITQKNWMPYY